MKRIYYAAAKHPGTGRVQLLAVSIDKDANFKRQQSWIPVEFADANEAAVFTGKANLGILNSLA